MRQLTEYTAALATLLEAVQAGSGGRPLELLRKESLAGGWGRRVFFFWGGGGLPGEQRIDCGCRGRGGSCCAGVAWPLPGRHVPLII